MKIDKIKVKKVLDFLTLIPPEEIRGEKDTLDFEKLKNRIDVQVAITKLKEMGVDGKYLFDNFLMAGLVLGHLLNEEK